MANPVRYAEETLDVHGPWTEAQERLAQHSDASVVATKAKGDIRTFRMQLKDRAAVIAADAPSQSGYPSGVQARREFIKLLISVDTETESLEDRIAECQATLEDAQADLKHHELGLHVLTARMTELGGLLQFYAVAKTTQISQSVDMSTRPQVEGK